MLRFIRDFIFKNRRDILRKREDFVETSPNINPSSLNIELKNIEFSMELI